MQTRKTLMLIVTLWAVGLLRADAWLPTERSSDPAIPQPPGPTARIVDVVDKLNQGSSRSVAPPQLRRSMVNPQIELCSANELSPWKRASTPAEPIESSIHESPSDSIPVPASRPRGQWVKNRSHRTVDRLPPLAVQEARSRSLEPISGREELTLSERMARDVEQPNLFQGVEDEIPLRRIAPALEREIQLVSAEQEVPTEPTAPELAERSAPVSADSPARLALAQAEPIDPEPAVDSRVQPVIHHPPTSTLVTAPGPLTAPTKTLHIIQIGDELDIAFPYQPVVGDATAQRLQPPLFRTERVVVREDGMIVVPLIDPVMAAGLTPEDVRSSLIEAYLPFQYDPLSNLKSGMDRQYRICVNDEIDIRVRNQPDLDDIVTVRPDGKISVARVGSVVVEGKTIDEIEKEIAAAIARLVAQPEVSVSLRQFHSEIYYEGETMKRIGLKNLEGISVIVRTAERRVFVMGEVKGAGQVPYRGTMTLNQAIASAGGPLRTAKLRQVKVVRQTGSQQPPRTILIDLRSTIRGRGVEDIELQHLDVVVVGKTPIARFTDTLEQYIFNVAPFTRNNPNFNFFYSLGGGGGAAAGIVSP